MLLYNNILIFCNPSVIFKSLVYYFRLLDKVYWQVVGVLRTVCTVLPDRCSAAAHGLEGKLVRFHSLCASILCDNALSAALPP